MHDTTSYHSFGDCDLSILQSCKKPHYSSPMTPVMMICLVPLALSIDKLSFVALVKTENQIQLYHHRNDSYLKKNAKQDWLHHLIQQTNGII